MPSLTGDIGKLTEIYKELREMSDRQAKLDMMDSWPDMERCIDDLIERLEEFLDYDPTPNNLYDHSGGEPPVTMQEMHSAAWKEHQEVHR